MLQYTKPEVRQTNSHLSIMRDYNLKILTYKTGVLLQLYRKSDQGWGKGKMSEKRHKNRCWKEVVNMGKTYGYKNK